MAETYNPAQSAPSATTLTDAYTATSKATILSISVCNRGSSSTFFRIARSIGGGAVASEDYLYYNHTLPGAETYERTAPILLNTGDKVRVYAGNDDVSFNFEIVEET
jgi:hypothetical protein